jgi:hypothetical protein
MALQARVQVMVTRSKSRVPLMVLNEVEVEAHFLAAAVVPLQHVESCRPSVPAHTTAMTPISRERPTALFRQTDLRCHPHDSVAWQRQSNHQARNRRLFRCPQGDGSLPTDVNRVRKNHTKDAAIPSPLQDRHFDQWHQQFFQIVYD